MFEDDSAGIHVEQVTLPMEAVPFDLQTKTQRFEIFVRKY
jgi:hypothetical protein